MASQASIIPADRQEEPKPSSSTTVTDSAAVRTPAETSTDSPELDTSTTKRTAKKSAGSSKKHHRCKNGKNAKASKKNAKSGVSDDEEEDDDGGEDDLDISEDDSESDEDEDDIEALTSTKKANASKKNHINVQDSKKSKKLTAKKAQPKKASAKAKKEKKKMKAGKKSKKTNTAESSDSDSDSDSDSSSSGDSDHEVASESKEAESGLKGQFDVLQQQVAQLQFQLSQQRNSQSQFASAVGFPMAFPMAPAPAISPPINCPPAKLGLHSLISQPPPLSRRGRGRGRGGRRGYAPPRSSETGDSQASNNEGGNQDADGKKKSKKIDFKRVDWVWDDNIHNYRLQDTAEADADSQYDDFIFHVRRTFDWEGKYRETVVDIRSKLLREALQDVIGNVEGVSLVDEIPKLDPNLLFLYLEDLRSHLKHLKKTEPAGESKQSRKKNQKRLDTKRKHTKVLIKYLDEDYAHIKESLYPMLDSGLITFELLWALWKPNTLAYTTTYGTASEPRVFKVEMAQLHSSIMKGKFYYIDGKYFEFDGKRFGYGNLSSEIPEFQGARKITSLSCYPLKYRPDEEQVRQSLIERGKKFVTLSGVHYKSYSGIAFMKRKKNIIKFNIQKSRVMIDPAIFRRINPNYCVSMVRPKDPDVVSDDENSGSEAGSDCCCQCDSSDEDNEDKSEYVTKLFRGENGEICMARVSKDEVDDEEMEKELLDLLPEENKKNKTAPVEEDTTKQEFTDEEYLTASPVVLGFAFSDKQWLELAVSGVQEIKWNAQAWDSLVLEEDTKDLIKALVESRKYHAANTIDDVIQGKGKGLVTVLHGPPGTGKTLTAEGISELLKCPLYMVSAGELGTDSRFLEAELQKILDICHAWGAILLLDEADVFLEKRNMHDIHRNALVSIFLRQLEYFQGILFLTTNRVETFDEAFQSRIHIALRYENLDARAKRTIFQMFMDRVKAMGKIEVKPLTEDDLHMLSLQDLNGREIKNVVGSAQDLAVNKGEALSMRHIKQVLNVHAKFGRDLKGGTGYEDAMRSYF